MLGEVTINYRPSALAEDHGGSIGPIAGDRAPDGVVVRAADPPTHRLLEAMAGPRWSLLVFAGLEAECGLASLLETARQVESGFGRQVAPILVTAGRAPAGGGPGTVLYDRDNLLHERYGVRCARHSTWSGRIGMSRYLRGAATRSELLLKYLERWLVMG